MLVGECEEEAESFEGIDALGDFDGDGPEILQWFEAQFEHGQYEVGLFNGEVFALVLVIQGDADDHEEREGHEGDAEHGLELIEVVVVAHLF